MATLDPNAWYRISETRVDNSTGPFALNLQLRTEVNGLRVHPITGGTAAWQFQPYGDVKGRYLMRLDQTGVKAQLSACYDSDEPATGNTIACMKESSTDESQLWDVSDFGSGTFKFVNVKNGTSYVLDVHPKDNLFMSNEIDGSEGVAENQLAQHWVLSSVSAVNDGAYSTIYSGNVAVSTNSAALSSSATTITTTRTTTTSTSTGSTQTSSTTGTASPADAMSTSTATSTPSKGISTAAGAGIGVAVALSVVGLIGAVAFFWWRRSQRPSKTKYSEVEAKNGEHPDRGSSIGISQSGESAPSSLHGVSPTVGVSSLNAWQPASSVNVPPASSFVNGQQQQSGYYAPGQQATGGQQSGYYMDHQQQAIGGQQAAVYAGGQPMTITEQQNITYVSGPSPVTAGSYSGQSSDFSGGDGPIASLYGQRLPPTTSQTPGASIYGQRNAPTSGSASLYGQSVGPTTTTAAAVPRHQFDHPTAAAEFAPGAANTTAQRNVYGASQNQTSSTVNLADFEPMPQPHELEAAEREIVRRQHELGTFHHGPDLSLNEQPAKAPEAPKVELSAYQHGPDTFSRNEAKMLGAPTAELGAYQHGPDTFENEHEAKVLGAYHPGQDAFTREREDKVLGSFHDIMNLAKPTGRGGTAPQSYEMNPIRPTRGNGDTNR